MPLSYLCQALSVVGIETPQEVLTSRYPELCKEEYVNKVSFVFVLQEEHNRLGYSFKKLQWINYSFSIGFWDLEIQKLINQITKFFN